MSAWSAAFVEIVKFTIPALVVFLTVYFMMRQYLDKQLQFRTLDMRKKQNEVTVPLRLQAYERLSLFCERIDLPNLILRVRKDGMNASSLRINLLLAIQKEYEHNITQQVYVSDKLWEIIQVARDDAVNTISTVSEMIEPDADGRELARAILDLSKKRGGTGPGKALEAVKKEAGLLL